MSVHLGLIGPFEARLETGAPIVIRAKKARALLAMLAVAPKGKRTRHWLQYKLWSDRGEKEGAASLRQTLSGLRRSFGAHSVILRTGRTEIGLDLDRVRVDLNDIPALLAENPAHADGEFLEGLDIPDNEFDNWLRDQRLFWADKLKGVSRLDRPAPSARPPARKPLPYLAVIPAATNGAAAFPAHLTEGIVDQIIDQMSRVKWIATLSRNSSFAPDTARGEPAEIGARMGADFVLACGLQRQATGYSLEAELIQLPMAVVTWRSTFDIPVPVTQAGVGDICTQIAGNLGSVIGHLREQHAQSQNSRDDRISDLIWRGRWHMHRLSGADFQAARLCFDKVIAQEPGNADAHLYRSLTKLWQIWTERGSQERLVEVRREAQHAVKLDVSDGRGYWIVGTAETWLRNFDAGERYVDEAIRLCPSLAFAHSQRGTIYAYTGRPAQALDALAEALRLSPFDQQRFNFLGEMAMAAFLSGDNELALQKAQETTMLRPAYWYAHMIKALALARLSRAPAAREALRELLHHRPNFAASYVRWLPFQRPEQAEELLDELNAIDGTRDRF